MHERLSLKHSLFLMEIDETKKFNYHRNYPVIHMILIIFPFSRLMSLTLHVWTIQSSGAAVRWWWNIVLSIFSRSTREGSGNSTMSSRRSLMAKSNWSGWLLANTNMNLLNEACDACRWHYLMILKGWGCAKRYSIIFLVTCIGYYGNKAAVTCL